MSDQPTSTPMRDDNRAVSTVIGVVILFGFLILALSLYQVEVVPQQNAETEFQHSGEVRNDLVELRAGILQAGSIDQPQYQTVQLGTTYSNRVFSINPPAPAGTIRTSESYPITIAYESNETVIETIPTRFIEYRPGYNELDRSPTWYDASVLYLDARDEDGGIAVIEDQALVNGGEVQITALQNEFRQSGTRRVTLELRPAESVTGEIPEGNLIVTVPTRLSDDEYWGGTDIPDNEYSITDDTNDDGVYNLTLETTTSNLTVNTVGVQEAPEEPTQNDAVRIGDNGGDGGDGGDGSDNTVNNVNSKATSSGNSGQVSFVLNNTGGAAVVATGITVNSTSTNATEVSNGDILTLTADGTQIVDQTITIGNMRYGFTPNVTISSNSEVTFKFNKFRDPDVQKGSPNVGMSGEDITITVYFGDGTKGTFTISPT